jgi:alpha-2-macroglobulin
MPVLARLALLCLCLITWLACGTKPASTASSHTKPTSGPIGVVASARAPVKTGPVEVTYAGPRGETDGRVELSVSFDRPMVPLGSQTDVAPGLLTIEPDAPGHLRWVGSQTLLFEPRAALPMATEYRVRVAAGLRALDGQALARDYTFDFGTPALAVVEHDAPGARALLERRYFDLYFNQAVAPERVREFGALRQHGSRGARELAFTVERPDAKDLRRVRVVPKTPFALGSQIELRLRAGLPGQEGPRTLPADYQTSFRIYGPLRLLPSAPCGGDDCTPRITFSNPVRTGAVYARLRFEPPLATPLAREDDYESEELYFGSELAPDTTYRVSIEGELEDVYGTKLVGERTAVIRTPPHPALARLLVAGELIHESEVPALRVQLQNLRDARLELYPLAFEDVWPSAYDEQQPRVTPIAHALGHAGPSERRLAAVDPTAALKNGKGVLLASVSARSKGEALHERKLLAFTDLAPTLKAGASGGVVWVTRLSSAQPVAGASVRIVDAGSTLATGKTDDKGLFAYALPPRGVGESASDHDARDLAAVVEKDGDVSFTRKFAGVGPWELTEHASYGSAGPSSAHLFTERGIYRPGDTVQLKGILRTQGKAGLAPARGEVSVRALDGSGSELERTTLQLGGYGTFVHAIRIPGSAELGPLTMHVQHGEQVFTTSAEVAEYRPAELEVTLRAAHERVVRGDQVSAQVVGHYLFGAPASEAAVFWSARYLLRSFEPAGYPGFSFADESDEAWQDRSFAVAASGEGKLDAHGELRVQVPLVGAPSEGPSTLELESSVTSHGAQVSRSTTVQVTPASILVGLRAGSALGAVAQPVSLELVALSPDATPQPDLALEVTFARRAYTSSVVDGQVVYEARDERVGGCRPKSKVEPVRCSFTPRAPGLHVARVRGKDRLGRVSTAARYVYVAGSGDASWGAQDDGYLFSLQSDKQRFALGETARVLVPSPWPEAEALVTVEREGVLSVERLRVGRANTIDVRIDERFVPNAFVSVLLLRPHAGEPSDASAAMPYRIGALELAADVSERKLAVELKTDRDEKRPGEEVTLQLAVRDGSGTPTQAELTVFAVDEGVLALTGYRTPDPFAAIYEPRALSVWTSDARSNLARMLAGVDDEKGGDEGGGGGALVRSNFAALALYVPSLETDAQGRAELRFKLPDGTTRYRIMAVAASRGAHVGAGETSVRTHKPLMLRPLAPRVLRAGDRLEAGVVVHNEQAQAAEVEVALQVSGLALRDVPRKKVRVPASGAVEVCFALEAERVGTAKLTLTARAGPERDAIAIERRVLSPSVIETVSVAGTTDGSAREALAPLLDVRRDVGSLGLSLATSALVELEAPARDLLAYEYGCTEQLSSRLIALAALERLRVPLALADASFAPQAASLAAELERHQRGDGSFGLWSASDATPAALSTYLTAYALLALRELAAAGLPVSPHASERAKRFLASVLRAPSPSGASSGPGAAQAALQQSQRAYVVYALARSGWFDPGYAGKLFEQRAELPLSSRVELLHALTSDTTSRARVETLLGELGQHVRVTASEAHLETNAGDAYAPLFVSDVRATSALVLALLELEPEHVLLPKLAHWLSSARDRAGSWRGTHDTAWAVMALAGYNAEREKVRPSFTTSARLGEQVIGEALLQGARAKASFELPTRTLPSGGESLALDKRGHGTLHYVVRLTYARAALPAEPSERGFFVERSYERITPAELARGDVGGAATEHAQVGDYVRVTLRVAVPAARRFVLITDPIPAGLEPVDLNLATELTAAAHALSTQAPRDHEELRDDRAVFAIDELPPGLYRYTYLARASTVGRFVAPPAKVEEMYQPETQGLTGASTFTVTP